MRKKIFANFRVAHYKIKMKIVVLNGTEVKGCTHNMKKLFLQSLGGNNEVTEYYFPKDCPAFCTGCKACFYKDISACPAKEYTMRIWESIKASDLIVVTSPSYCFGATAQIKAILDHFGTKWIAHSPEKEMFFKQAVIITNAIGAGMGNVVKVIGGSLSNWGISKIYAIKQALFDVNWELVAPKRKNKIIKKCKAVSKKVNKCVGKVKVSLKTKLYFKLFKFMQKMIHKSEIKKGRGETQDHKYWSKQGWLAKGAPWKK